MPREAEVAERVGIFDSGVGGLSVWREIASLGAPVEILYVADQAHIPYGSRRRDEVLDFARGITRHLAARGCEVVVVACNTASAVALRRLRREFPRLQFVGMEPAIKPAAQASRRQVVAVLGTPATLDGELFRSTLERHAAGLTILRQPCPGLVERIEAGELDGAALEAMLLRFLSGPLAAGADVLVLACTHYPLVGRVIEKLAGEQVQVIDPAPAVARQVRRCLGLESSSARPAVFWTTGPVAAFETVAARILGATVHAAPLRWRDGELIEAEAAAEGSEGGR
jgi:glutamate racemase